MKTERLVVLINGISGVLLLWISSTSLFQCFHPTETAIFGAALCAFLLSLSTFDYAGWIDGAHDERVTCPTCGQPGKDYNPEGYSKVRSRPL